MKPLLDITPVNVKFEPFQPEIATLKFRPCLYCVQKVCVNANHIQLMRLNGCICIFNQRDPKFVSFYRLGDKKEFVNSLCEREIKVSLQKRFVEGLPCVECEVQTNQTVQTSHLLLNSLNLCCVFAVNFSNVGPQNQKT